MSAVNCSPNHRGNARASVTTHQHHVVPVVFPMQRSDRRLRYTSAIRSSLDSGRGQISELAFLSIRILLTKVGAQSD